MIHLLFVCACASCLVLSRSLLNVCPVLCMLGTLLWQSHLHKGNAIIQNWWHSTHSKSIHIFHCALLYSDTLDHVTAATNVSLVDMFKTWPEFISRVVCIENVVNKIVLREIFFLALHCFPTPYHSTNAPNSSIIQSNTFGPIEAAVTQNFPLGNKAAPHFM
jgi:hypothetical protein